MKSITMKRLGLTAGLTGALFAAGSLQAQPFEPGIDFTADIASNYVFRGFDLHANKFSQDGTTISGSQIAPAFQPSLTFNFAEGWSMNIWGSFAMTGRADVDSDGLLQDGAGVTTGSAASYISGISNGNLNIGNILGAYTITSSTLSDSSTVPGFYKEANGLKRADEIDVTLSYSTSSKLGSMTGGIISYNYVNISQQTASDLEMFVGFSPAALPDLSLTTYFNVGTPGKQGSTYTYLSYGFGFELGKDMALDIAPGIAYATDTSAKIQGLQNANLPITLSIGGFHVGVTGVYRPETAFFDTDSSKGDAVALIGGSGKFDGLTLDPAGNTGVGNTIVNGILTTNIQTALTAGGAPSLISSNYSYTPRQSIPKTLFYYTIGYSMSF